jgi:hypothetical protein
MSDHDPNKRLNTKRMQVEVFGLQLNIQRLELRMMEIEDEKVKIAENVEAATKRIAELQNTLNQEK